MIRHKLTAAGGETSLALPFVYQLGRDQLTVLVDSQVVEHTERTRDSVGLPAALTAGAAVEVRATLPSLWDRVPPHWRVDDEDADGVLFALFEALDGELSLTLDELRALPNLRRVDDVPPRFLASLARDLGWELDISRLLSVAATAGQTSVPVPWLADVDLTRVGVLVNGEAARFAPSPGAVTVLAPHGPLREGDQVVVYDLLLRKVVAALVPLYRQKGTRPGILAALRVFLGLEGSIRALWADGWWLGRSHLGTDTRLAPPVHLRTMGAAGQTTLALPFRVAALGDVLLEINGVASVPSGTLGAWPAYPVLTFPALTGGERLEVTDARAALTLVVRLPRTLTPAERELTLRVLDAWKPAKAVLVLEEPEAPAAGAVWRLGHSRLGSLARGAATWTFHALGGETSLTLPFVFAHGQLQVIVDGTPLALGGPTDTAPREAPPAGLRFAAPLATGATVVVRWMGTTRLG